ncbi:MauE/DoxX family redox-associated membrane protein [Streptomyces sp. NPDC046931]|uniref:MauE/DoxX family redox-associated membrane protein n=1 Tax=Streptomyces sp. NPDC046931 TaxID=3154806 RepID=UPI0033E09B1C
MTNTLWAIRCLIGVVFLVSAASKAGRSSFAAFVTSVVDMRILPRGAAAPAAVCTVAAEGAVAGLLAAPARHAVTAGLLLAAGLLAVFTAAIALAVRRGTTVPCRCFGASVTPLGSPHIVRNTLLAGAAAFGAVCSAVAARPAPSPAGVVVPAVLGLTAGALVTRLDDLSALFRPVPSGSGSAPRPSSRQEEKRHVRPDSGPGPRRGPVRTRPDPHSGHRQTAA